MMEVLVTVTVTDPDDTRMVYGEGAYRVAVADTVPVILMVETARDGAYHVADVISGGRLSNAGRTA